jgi:carbon-monoxide dehydrogenase medium subunit
VLYKKYCFAKSLDEAIELLNSNDGSIVRPIAGGTDLMLQLNEGVTTIDVLVDVSGIPELLGIQMQGDCIHLGASLPYIKIINSELLSSHALLLVEASRLVGAAQIQNMGTLGGNIANASPAGDMLPCLYALDAEITISGLSGDRKVPIKKFFLGYRHTDLKPGELIKEISFKSLPAGVGSAFVKYGLRQSQAISVVMVAAIMHLRDNMISKASIVMGAVAPTIVNCPSAEQVLINQEPSLELFERAGQAARADICPIDDVRGSAEFRRYLTKTLVKRALEKAWKRAINAD